jgi:anhydro-N-acetylmuramic acid kinase
MTIADIAPVGRHGWMRQMAKRKLASHSRLRAAGLMSGTSVDGIDVAIIDWSGRHATTIAHATYPYPAAVREGIFRLFDVATASIDDLCHLNFVIGELFADALLKLCRDCGVAIDSIDVIGSHGQTVWHDPVGKPLGRKRIRSTLQIGEPAIIAERTGRTTIADFRVRDIAAGGQGAPLVPFADFLLLSDDTRTRAVQNIGGIANVTLLRAGGTIDDVVAFDTGPGNMIIDRCVEIITSGKQHFDCSGALAATGQPCEPLVRELMRDAYFKKRPPKTTGREYFGVAYADMLAHKARRHKLSDADLIATATALTARTIADAYCRFSAAIPDEVILCGGGARNAALVQMIRQALPTSRVCSADEFGIDSDAKEAIAFAILAAEALAGRCNNVPAATGANRAVVMGKIVPGNGQQ